MANLPSGSDSQTATLGCPSKDGTFQMPCTHTNHWTVNSSWAAKLTVDKTVGSSPTVLGSCRETDVPHSGAWDR